MELHTHSTYNLKLSDKDIGKLEDSILTALAVLESHALKIREKSESEFGVDSHDTAEYTLYHDAAEGLIDLYTTISNQGWHSQYTHWM